MRKIEKDEARAALLIGLYLNIIYGPGLSPDQIREWLYIPQPLFNDKSMMDMLEEGKVIQAVDLLRRIAAVTGEVDGDYV